jgi:hypothetical protein
MLTLLIVANFSISDHCKRFCIVSNHILLCGNYLGLDAPPYERFVFSCFHASSDDDNRSPFQFSLARAIFPKTFSALNDNENDNETISFS